MQGGGDSVSEFTNGALGSSTSRSSTLRIYSTRAIGACPLSAAQQTLNERRRRLIIGYVG